MYSEYRQLDNGRPGGFLRRRKTPLIEYRDDDGNRSIYRAGGEKAFSKPVKQFTLQTKQFGKAASLQPRFYFDPAAAERQEGKRQRLSTEAQHQGARGAELAAAGVGSAALAARSTSGRSAPSIANAARSAAIHRGVPKEHADAAHTQFHRVRAYAKPRRGRLLAGATAAAGAASAAGAVARWKRDEATGISQDLGRSAAGARYSGYKREVGKSLPLVLAMEAGNAGVKLSQKMTPADVQRARAAAKVAGGGSLVATGAYGTSRAHEVRTNRKVVRNAQQTSKQRGMREVEKAEQHLEEVAKSSYLRRTVRDPGSELDVLAAASLMLNAQHGRTRIPWHRKKQLNEQLQLAIARGYLNAPYTTGI